MLSPVEVAFVILGQYSINYCMRSSELILNEDKSIYHLGIHPDQVGDIIITVGDPHRVDMVSRHFDKIIVRKESREFVTHAGYVKDRRVTVISTGIGTDNIDIVLNELDALINCNLETGVANVTLRSLDIIRIGTSGAIQADIPVDTFVASEYGIGFDALQPFYDYKMDKDESALHQKVADQLKSNNINIHPTIARSSLPIELEGIKMTKGITITAPGFYAPQGRQIRLKPKYPNIINQMESLEFNGLKCTNLEMETSGIYTLANLLGHRAISLNAILANRVNGVFSQDPQATVNKLIDVVVGYLRG